MLLFKKNSCAITAIQGYMLNIYNIQNKMYTVYYLMSFHELFYFIFGSR